LSLVVGFAASCSAAPGAGWPLPEPAALHARSLQTLHEGLRAGSRWIKVHAAEDLIALGRPQEAAAVFEPERTAHDTEPQYRIGIWRVLAQAADSPAGRDPWVAKIRQAFLEPAGPDQGHALESLGKLGYQVRPSGDEAFTRALASTNAEIVALARWVLANGRGPAQEQALVGALADPDARTRGLTAYALTYQPRITEASLARLATAIRQEPADSSARVFLLSAGVTHARAGQQTEYKAALVAYAAGTPRQKCEVGAGLARCGAAADLPQLWQLLQDSDLDVRVAAAHAILQLERRPAPR
jgi:solute:Na+ symporter, SSS family